MALTTDAKALAQTLRGLYGDILDLPILQNHVAKHLPERSADGAGTHSAAQSGAHPQLSPSEALAAYAEEIRFCKECVFHIGRRNLVFGRGQPEARVVFVGDFPSDQDDAKGEPFSDDAGDLLNKMIIAMKLKPEETYLTNISKCRPPAGAQPLLERFDHEAIHLEQQFKHLSATFVVALGDSAARLLARSESPLPVLRKQIFEWNGRQVFCTHHPRDLLQSPAKKKEAWEDLRLVMRAMGVR